MQSGARDGVVVDSAELGIVFDAELVTELARLADGDAIRQCVGMRELPGAPALQGRRHRVELGTFDANDAYLGSKRAQRHDDPGEQSAAAHGHDYRGKIGALFGELQADHTLSGHHCQVVVAMNETAVLPLRKLAGVGMGRIVVTPMEHDGGAVLLRTAHLYQRGLGRHDDGRRDIEALGVKGEALGVVACGRRDDPFRSLFGR